MRAALTISFVTWDFGHLSMPPLWFVMVLTVVSFAVGLWFRRADSF